MIRYYTLDMVAHTVNVDPTIWDSGTYPIQITAGEMTWRSKSRQLSNIWNFTYNRDTARLMNSESGTVMFAGDCVRMAKRPL